MDEDDDPDNWSDPDDAFLDSSDSDPDYVIESSQSTITSTSTRDTVVEYKHTVAMLEKSGLDQAPPSQSTTPGVPSMSFSIGRGGSPIQTTRNSENIRPIGRGARSTPPPSRNSASPGIGGSPSPGSPGKGRAVGRGFPKHFNHQEKPNKVL